MLFVKPPNGNWKGMMRSVADGPVGVDGGWNHQPLDCEPVRRYTVNQHDSNMKLIACAKKKTS
jgi:hypothetical protein